MPSEPDRIALTTATEADRRPRDQPRQRWIKASLTTSGTRGKVNAAAAEPIAGRALTSGVAMDHPSVAALVVNPDRVVDVPVNQIAARCSRRWPRSRPDSSPFKVS